MKKAVFILLAVILLAGYGYPKEKKMTERQEEIVKFEKERKELQEGIKAYEDAIQNLKYRIAQLNALIEYLKEKEEGKK